MTAGSGSHPRVVVLGLGLVGGSLTRTLHAAGWPVRGWDSDPQTREQARAAGLSVLGTLEDLRGADVDLVVLAVPLVAMEQSAATVAGLVGPGTVVTDVGSVKGPVRDAVRAAGLGDRYVGAHPMAGTEHSGFAASDPELLRGVRWAVTLDAGTRAQDALLVLSLVVDGCAGTAFPLTDEVHDEATALISHVPHVVATELLNLVARSPIRDLAVGLSAGSFRDGTRVGRTTPRRTQAMVTDNAAWVAAALRRAAHDLEQVAGALETNAPTDEFFDRADVLRDPAPRAEVTSELALAGLDGWQGALTALGAGGGEVRAVDRDRGTVVVTGPLQG